MDACRGPHEKGTKIRESFTKQGQHSLVRELQIEKGGSVKYRVLRYFEGEEEHQTLIGHYETKRMASNAITDDAYGRRSRPAGLKYSVEEVETELTQAEIDVIFKLSHPQ